MMEQFYLERDKRTKEYLREKETPLNQGVSVSISREIASTKNGQFALLILINTLVRVHRKIDIVLAAEEVIDLKIKSLFENTSLQQEITDILNKADPYGEYSFNKDPDNFIKVAFGEDKRPNNQLYIGGKNFIGQISKKRIPFDVNNESSIIGLSIACCYAAAFCFNYSLKSDPISELKISLWNLKGGEQAALGPEKIILPKIENGLIIGTGAVGNNFSFWLYHFDDTSNWSAIDKDKIDLSNTNRALLFFPYDTSFFGNIAKDKVSVFKRYVPNSQTHNHWFDQHNFSQEKEFDLVLCLANEREVRKLVNGLFSDITMQATTGSNWSAQLHRHIPGLDDCPSCRMEGLEKSKGVQFQCSSAKVEVNKKSSDAALPFLSVSSSLMLFSYLCKLNSSPKEIENINDWSLTFIPQESPLRRGKRKCSKECEQAKLYTLVKGGLQRNNNMILNQA